MLILMGPSASGKTEVAKILEQNFNLKKVITHTTRSMRINEKNDIDYHFVTKEVFLAMKNNNQFIETTTYNNNFYGTSKNEINDNKCIILDPKGAKSFYDLKNNHIYIVYLQCDEETRIARMVSRLDKQDIIKLRINSDRLTFTDNCKSICNLILNSNNINPDSLSNIIYNAYMKHLQLIK